MLIPLSACRLPPFDQDVSLSLIDQDDGIPQGGMLVARWEFKVGDFLADSSGNGVTLTDFGNVTPSPFAGRDSLVFDTVGGLLVAGSPLLYSITNGQSVSFWYYGNTFPQGSIVRRLDTVGTRVWKVGPHVAGQLNVVEGTQYLGGTSIDFGAGFTAGAWNHIVVVYDVEKNRGQIYVNNTASTTLSPLTVVHAVESSIFLGGNSGGSPSDRAPQGERISDVRIYNYALRANHVEALFKE